MKKLVGVVALSCTLTILAACGSSSTTSVNLVGLELQQPHAGTTITYNYVFLDSTGTPRTEEEYGHDTILATGMTYAGKRNVTQYSNWNPFSKYVCYEANGDISYSALPVLAERPNLWVTIPLASHSVMRSLTPDSVNMIWYTYTGTSPQLINGTLYNVESFDVYEGPAALGVRGVDHTELFDAATGIMLVEKYVSRQHAIEVLRMKVR